MPPNADLSAVLGPARPPAAAELIGLEHEYRVEDGGRQLDFRLLIHDLPVDGRRLDPGDANAYRCRSGLVVTCDEREAEVAAPPVEVQPGFTENVSSWAEVGRRTLAELLPDPVLLRGYSTHLSTSMPERLLGDVAVLFSHTFAPSLMMLIDSLSSHGVFLRPRPARLELCGEYVFGSRLRAASTLFAGGARACVAALDPHAATHRPPVLPPLLDVQLRPATGRYGVYVGRHSAFGFDLYAEGRRARLARVGGGNICAQDHLTLAAGAARAALAAEGNAVATADFEPVEEIVSGAAPLGIEGEGAETAEPGRPARPPPALSPSPFGQVLEVRRRHGITVSPHTATWWFTVFAVEGPQRRGFVCIPSPSLGTFLHRLDGGRLDSLLSTFVQSEPSGSRLSSYDQTKQAGTWDEVGPPHELIPPEREATGAYVSTARADKGRARIAKPLVGKVSAALPTPAMIPVASKTGTPPPLSPPPPSPPPRGLPRAVVIALAAVAAALVAAVAAAATGVLGGPDKPVVNNSPLTTSAPALSSTSSLPPASATEPPLVTTTRVAPTSIRPVTTRPPVTAAETRPSTTALRPTTTSTPKSTSTTRPSAPTSTSVSTSTSTTRTSTTTTSVVA